MADKNDICYIDEKEYLLSEVEKMGMDAFCLMFHKFPYRQSLFKYYPNTKKYSKKERKSCNYSFEALKNNTVFLQNAEKFDDCFDCAVDLDEDKFLFERVSRYCEYFNVDVKSDNLKEVIHALGEKLCSFGTIEKCKENILFLQDEVQRLCITVFITNVFVLARKSWEAAIIIAIQKEFENFRKVLSNFKISCFSDSPYLNRMWSSAYADNNRGFCVEYEIDLSQKDKNELYINIFPVIYSQTRNDFFPLSKNYDKILSKEDLWQMFFNGLLRKSVYWKDQHEWRLILCDGLIKQNPMPFFKIKKVYLGNKMSINERTKIIKFCRSKNIQYVGLVREPNSFNLVECKGECCSCGKKLIANRSKLQN